MSSKENSFYKELLLCIFYIKVAWNRWSLIIQVILNSLLLEHVRNRDGMRSGLPDCDSKVSETPSYAELETRFAKRIDPHRRFGKDVVIAWIRGSVHFSFTLSVLRIRNTARRPLLRQKLAVETRLSHKTLSYQGDVCIVGPEEGKNDW